ncbi:trk system potassium uptake protein TrkA [Peptoclostridium litorale DSM 5388]|uniref:Kef-type K+ transport system, membrane component n=1 Tax=Peptoclostridium litorale DSM 5388 TaxID=1121324 RepID=A0A069RHD8_PEPLI|nr:cation:proton antiporter [Peptoclostridium litorale]KDR96188.1 Kef-type K+ transport system, membrane component [Peptoclostridium litorale DSM 5388]SIO13211.1 trk system potassium uptake protein TrkA [Peptoclostridium litorale DSM 5388]
MEHGDISYISLLVIVLLALFVPIVINKFKFLPIPIVVGEIIAGMIVGKSGLGLIEESSWLTFLYTFGLVFLMFLSGLEIDFKFIKPARREGQKWHKDPVVTAIMIFVMTLSFSFAISSLLKNMGLVRNAYLMTLILSTTSLGIVVPILKEKNLINTDFGQTILLSAIVSDFGTMTLITFFIAFYTSGATYKVLLSLLLFVAFFVVHKAASKVTKNKVIEDILHELSHATSQIQVRGTFALILVFIALSQVLGTEIILGAFLAGVIVSFITEGEGSQLSSKLDAIGYGFFIPIFFIMVGANFDIKDVLSNPKAVILMPGLLAAAYAVKFIPALMLKRSYPLKMASAAGFLLSSRLSLIIAASAIGLKLGILSKEVNGSVILVAIATCTLSPLFFNHMMGKVEEPEKKKTFIIGINEKSLLIIRRLKKIGVDVVAIAFREDKIDSSAYAGGSLHIGDPSDMEWLRSTGIEQAKTVVVSYADENIYPKVCKICDVLKRDVGIEKVILATNNSKVPSCIDLESVVAISPDFASALIIENLIIAPNATEILFQHQDEFYVAEIKVHNLDIAGRAISKLSLPGDCLILSILREDEKIIPHGNDVLEFGDTLMIVGSREDVERVRFMFSGIQYLGGA